MEGADRVCRKAHPTTIPDSPQPLRTLTLIVTDLHAPPGLDAAALGDIPRLPAAECVRARGATCGLAIDWRDAVLTSLGMDAAALQPLAVAEIAWFGLSGERSSKLWCATPVKLGATMDHVRLDHIGVRPSAADAALVTDFNREFHEAGLKLHCMAGVHWFLELQRELNAACVAPGRVLGRDVADDLPSGADGPYLRRVMTEIQMWLHGVGDERARFNALWLWGGGHRWPEFSGQTLPVAASSEPLLRGLWRLAGRGVVSVPKDFAGACGLDAENLLVTLSLEELRLEHPGQPLERLERDWFAPAWDALGHGALRSLAVNLNGVLSRVTRAQRWRRWRTPRHWAESR